jgi:hypothetical protein
MNPFPNPDDVYNLALCGWREAEGEGILGVRAVMHVICNRAADWKQDLHTVVYGRNQFTSMSVPTDPRYKAFPPEAPKARFSFWQEILAVAPLVITGDDKDPTVNPQNGQKAHFYANLQTATSGWFFTNVIARKDLHPITTVLGKHTFFV